MGFCATSPAPEKSDPTAENRVWGFFGEAQETHRENRPQSPQPRQGNRLAPTTIASGRTYWPSRDPIGERGGVNLYGMVANNAVSWWDYLGLDRWDNISFRPNPGPEVNCAACHPEPHERPSKPKARGEYSSEGDAQGSHELIVALASRLGAEKSASSTILLAALPGGSIEFVISISGSVCPCKASDGTIGIQFTGSATGEINGGIGFVLGDKNIVAGTQQGGKYLTAKDKETGKDVDKHSEGTSGGLQASAAMVKCETTGSLQFNIGARGVGGIGFYGGKIDVPFGTLGTDKTEWDFKPKINASWGTGQPVGLRIELYGNATAEGKWASKK